MILNIFPNFAFITHTAGFAEAERFPDAEERAGWGS